LIYLTSRNSTKRNELEELEENLISPLIGNRTLYESLLNAVLENYKEDTLEEVIQKICDDKNAEALQDWRRFYTTYLAPLDLEAQNLIKDYNDLISDDEDYQIFTEFLMVMARNQLFVERWLNEKGHHETTSQYNSKDFEVEENLLSMKEFHRVKLALNHKRKELDQL